MSLAITTTKSCGPQLFPDGEPSHSWGPDELGQFCRVQHDTIVAGEIQLTPVYWRLGKALTLARRHFGRGQWGAYLASLGIERTRASRARAIFRTFATAGQVIGLAVEEAYGQRNRKRTKQLADDDPSTSVLHACLDHLRGEVECLLNETGALTRQEAKALLPTTVVIVQRLNELEERLRRQADMPAFGAG